MGGKCVLMFSAVGLSLVTRGLLAVNKVSTARGIGLRCIPANLNAYNTAQ
jgi:hypothetical protein